MFERIVGLRYLQDSRRSFVLLFFLILGLNLLFHGAGLTFFLPDTNSIAGLLGLILLILGFVMAYVCFLALFLSVYTVISVMGVTVGVAALTTVLSVMSGVEEDTQQKILGMNAHVIVQKKGGGDLKQWPSIIEVVKNVEQVKGASPFVRDEIMATSPTGIQGALLKGIEPSTIGEISELPEKILEGKGGLSYLLSPEKILTDYPVPRLGPGTLSDQVEFVPVPGDVKLQTPSSEETKPPQSFPQAPHMPEPDFEPIDPGRPRLHPRLGIEDPFAPVEDDLWEFPHGIRPTPGDLLPFEEIEVPGPPPSFPPIEVEKRVLPGVIVGEELAEETLHVIVGDEITLTAPWGDLGPTGPVPKTRSFRVAGIFYSGNYEFDARYIYMTLSDIQEFLLMDPELVTGVEIRLADLTQAREVAEKIEAELSLYEGGPYEVVPWQEINRSLFSALKVEKQMMFLVLIIVIIVAAFFIISSLLMVVVQKGKEIAILKSMGATGPMVMRIFFAAGSFIGLTGTVFGALGGYGLCRLIDWKGIPIPAEVYYISRLPVLIQPTEFVIVAAAALGISLIAALYPSYLASKMTPIEGLRL